MLAVDIKPESAPSPPDKVYRGLHVVVLLEIVLPRLGLKAVRNKAWRE